LEHVTVSVIPDETSSAVRIVCETVATAKTGVEMEAFIGTAVAAVTVYDMMKAVDPFATITDLQLMHKTGGKHDRQRSVECAQRS
jgi:cyclic pyranopterin phosphate synthase